MRKIYLGLFWRFFLVIFFFLILAAGLLSWREVQAGKADLIDQVHRQLEIVAGLVSQSIEGVVLQEILSASDSSDKKLDSLALQLRRYQAIYSEPQNRFKIGNIDILIQDKRQIRLLVSSDNSYQSLQKIPWQKEIALAEQSRKTFLLDPVSSEGTGSYQSFAAITDGNNRVVGIVRASVASTQLLTFFPRFWGHLGKYILPTILLSLLISFIISRRVTRPIDQFVAFVNRVSEGNYQERLNMETRDELEKISRALNVMLEKLEGLIETEVDRDRLQQQITSFLKIVSAAADGDFTVSAEVSADTLGALADSFNLMVEELSKLVRDVKGSSDQIAKSTHEVLKNTEIMSGGAETQAKEIETTYMAAREMAEIIKYANTRTQMAADAAHRTSVAGTKGAEVVKTSIEGMHRLRQTVQETARRVKLLGENSSEIGEIIEVISDIANRTNLLALNATIEAARAGDAGRGFAVVADEVRILAERSSQAARDIAVLIESIQAGTKEAVMAMENGTQEVEKGTRLVDETGNALNEIMENVEKSSQLITEISDAFQQQTKASSGIAKTMERIASIAQETAVGARKSRRLAEQMENLSKSLNAAVAKFRLSRT